MDGTLPLVVFVKLLAHVVRLDARGNIGGSGVSLSGAQAQSSTAEAPSRLASLVFTGEKAGESIERNSHFVVVTRKFLLVRKARHRAHAVDKLAKPRAVAQEPETDLRVRQVR